MNQNKFIQCTVLWSLPNRQTLYNARKLIEDSSEHDANALEMYTYTQKSLQGESNTIN